jgi:DNA helicase HerA-like ATPase
VIRLIRSKGVGVYFVTQSPSDVPETVLGQLGNRVQHALRAFTPKDQKAVKVAADTLRPNPKLDIHAAIMELAVGEALVSMLDEKGSPSVTERAWIAPPASQIGPIADSVRAAVRQRNSAVYGHYEQAIDRESAYEKLTMRTADKSAAVDAPPARMPGTGTSSPGSAGAGRAGEAMDSVTGALSSILFGTTGPRGGKHDGLVQSAAKSAARSMGSGVGRAILRGALGSILGGRR